MINIFVVNNKKRLNKKKKVLKTTAITVILPHVRGVTIPSIPKKKQAPCPRQTANPSPTKCERKGFLSPSANLKKG
jgi:hypothetical protein